MISRTSEVAACCSCASFSSRVWRSSFSCRSTTHDWPRRAETSALLLGFALVLATPSFHRFTACGAIPPHLALQFGKRTIPYHSIELCCASRQIRTADWSPNGAPLSPLACKGRAYRSRSLCLLAHRLARRGSDKTVQPFKA